MYYTLYTFLGWLLVILVTPFFIPYCLFTGKHLDSLKQRFGFFRLNNKWQHQQRIWFHAASVGEVQVAKALINECEQTGLCADYIITTVTCQGQLMAQSQLGGKALCLYAPIDLPWVVRNFLSKLSPTVYVCLETELWPNILKITHEQGIKSILLNGRMSEKSFGNYKILFPFFKQVLGCLENISVIHDNDRKRYSQLGYPIEKITITGNAKYALRNITSAPANRAELSLTDDNAATQQQYKKDLKIENEPVLIAGSTHTGEESQLIKTHAELANQVRGIILIIAPRHLERIAQVKKLLNELNVDYQTFSELRSAKSRHASLILLDVMGELSNLYSIATYVFCGGSLVDRGGHNIMEPALHGKAPIYGPHMNDFHDAVTLLENENAGFMVPDQKGLKNLISSFVKEPEVLDMANKKARAVAYAQKDSARKQVELLKGVLTN